MSHFETLSEARLASQSLRDRELKSAIVKCNVACGGAGLDDTGRGDLTGEHVQAREAAFRLADQRHKNRLAAAGVAFGVGAGTEGDAHDPVAKNWIETGEPILPVPPVSAPTAEPGPTVH